MFIVGTVDAPMCKFTRRLVDMLAPFQYQKIQTFDIMSDDRIAQWLKFYSNWPTYPQIFVQGNFVGGADIVCELIENEEFDEMVPQDCKKWSVKDELNLIMEAFNVITFIGDPKEKKLLRTLKSLSLDYLKVDLNKRQDILTEL